MLEHQTVCLRRLGADRANEVSYGRFFRNSKVTIAGLLEGNQERLAPLVKGRHILAPQDMSELSYTKHSIRTKGLGDLRYAGKGVLLHPMLAIDAQSEGCLGIVHNEIWTRSDARLGAEHRKKIPIEEKESYRWIGASEAAKKVLSSADTVTVIGDRESDIYELWEKIPDKKTHLLIRANHNRILVGQDKNLFEFLDSLPVVGNYAINIAANKNGVNVRRKTEIEVRFSKIIFKKPRENNSSGRKAIELYAIDARETSEKVPSGEEPIHWRLLTTHKIETFEQASECVRWYKQRWHIEQLFRILKLQGLRVEDSQLETVEGLIRLIAMATLVAARTLQLTLARDGALELPVENVFEQNEIAALKALNPTLEGKTEKQKNPNPRNSLRWATWIIARLGGWKGYASEAKPGPITFLRGFLALQKISFGFALAKGDVCIE